MAFGLGMGFGLTQQGASNPAQAAVNSWVAALSTQPSAADRAVYETFVQSLITAGVWSKLDFIYWLSNHDASGVLGANSTAMFNMKNPAAYKGLLVSGSNRFLTGQYVGTTCIDGLSAINTQFTPSTAGGNMTLNSHSIGVWYVDNAGTAINRLISASDGTNSIAITEAGATNYIYADSMGGQDNAQLTADASGMVSIMRRNSATAFVIKRNTAADKNVTYSTTALVTRPIYLHARNNVGTLQAGTTCTMRFAYGGAGLDDTEYTALYNAVNTVLTYMDSKQTQWAGSKIVVLGTSLDTTYGYVGDVTASPWQRVAAMMNATIINTAIIGNSIDGAAPPNNPSTSGITPFTVAEYIAQDGDWTDAATVAYRSVDNIFSASNHLGVNTSDADLYIFDVIPNNTDAADTDLSDFNFETWAYGTGDFAAHRGTFAGGYIYLLNALKTLNATARIAVMDLIVWGMRENANVIGCQADNETIATAISADELYIWDDLGITVGNHATYLADDDAHFIDAGKALVAQQIVAKLTALA